MSTAVGQIEAIFRYPVKSMRGEQLDAANLGWHGLAGDRRLALRRLDNHGNFPWLCGSMLPELTWFTPFRREGDDGVQPTHIRTPEGQEMELFGDELAAEVGRRYGSPVQMTPVKHGVFDEASVSVIASSTIREVCRLADQDSDVRRFRPNILISSTRDAPFVEEDWVGGVLTFGDADDAPSIAVTRPDLRCAMVNIDPEGGSSTPEVMKACTRANQSNAGIYCAITRVGRLAVGQTVFLNRG